MGLQVYVRGVIEPVSDGSSDGVREAMGKGRGMKGGELVREYMGWLVRVKV